MRWFVEVTSSEKADLQKYTVEAESWQRALQAARAQRGEQGPMSGFSIELLDEGYRAVDPVSRNKFVVKRAPDEAALSIPPPGATPAAKMDSKAPAALKAPKAPAPLPSKTSVPPAAIKPSIPPAAASSSPATTTPSKAPPRPADKKEEKKKSRSERKSEKMKAAAIKKAEAKSPSPTLETIEPEMEMEEAPKTDAEPAIVPATSAPVSVRPPQDSVPDAPLLPVGAFVPGLPSVKIMTKREQDPSEASPLAYREYAFSCKEGTSDETAEKILRAQLKLVQAHMEKLKQGKLVNLAVFDGEFTGKPAVPPLCTLAWKDWKGDPVVAFPRRAAGGPAISVKPPAPSVAPTPPSTVQAPASMPPPAAVNMPPGYSAPPPPMTQTQNIAPSGSTVPRPPGAIAAMVGAAKVGSERKLPVAAPVEPAAGTGTSPMAAPINLGQTLKDPVSAFEAAPQTSPSPFAQAPSAPPPSPGPVGPSTSPLMQAAQPVAASAVPQQSPFTAPVTPSVPPPANPFAAPSVPPPANPFAAPSVPPSANPFAAPSVPPPANPFVAPSVPPPGGSFPPPMGSVPPPAFNPVVVNQVPVSPHPSSPPTGRRSQPPEGSVRTPSGRFVRGRITGDELITQLFESMHDLHFLRDALDGGQFCLALAMEMIPVRAAIIHFFDIEKRHWIVACTRGKDAGKLLTTPTPETDDLLRAAARHRRAIVTPNGAHAQAQRYQTIGGARSIIIAPIMQAGRALGAIEMVNPLDGMPFNEDEGNAMTYIAEQYAEYLGSRGIVVQVDRIRAASTA